MSDNKPYTDDLPIYNLISYQTHMQSKAIDNFQKMFGIKVEVYRINKQNSDPYISAFGQTKTLHKDERRLDSLGVFKILANPVQMYYAYTSGGVGEIEFHYSTDQFITGDLIRYKWADGSVLEFQITELPVTYGDTYFTYKMKGVFNTKS